MKDDFFDDLDLDDEADEQEETPDWMALGDDRDEDEDEGSDEFDRLRQKSARAGSAFDDIAEEDVFSNESSSSFSLQGLTSSQRMILAILVLLNVIVIGIAVALFIL